MCRYYSKFPRDFSRLALNKAQPLSLGIFRSDYIVHEYPLASESKLAIKQVEFNTIASSFGGLSAKVSTLHRYGRSPTILTTALNITQGTFSIYLRIPPRLLQLFNQHLFRQIPP